MGMRKGITGCGIITDAIIAGGDCWCWWHFNASCLFPCTRGGGGVICMAPTTYLSTTYAAVCLLECVWRWDEVEEDSIGNDGPVAPHGM